MEQRRPQPRRRREQPRDHRIAVADARERCTVVIERQHARDLPAHGVHVRVAVNQAVHAAFVLTNLDAGLLRVAVDAKRQAQHAVPRGFQTLAEPERGGLAQRERPLRYDGEHATRLELHADPLHVRGSYAVDVAGVCPVYGCLSDAPHSRAAATTRGDRTSSAFAITA